MKLIKVRLISVGFAMLASTTGLACGKSPEAPTANEQTISTITIEWSKAETFRTP